MEEDFGGGQGLTKGCGAKGRRIRIRIAAVYCSASCPEQMLHYWPPPLYEPTLKQNATTQLDD
jgi:hypothetical protein